MWQLIARTFEELVLPPGVFLVLLGASLLLMRWKTGFGRLSVLVVLLAFYLCSSPYFAGLLIQRVELHAALDTDRLGQSPASAIVLLSGDLAVGAAEYGGDTVGAHSLLRSRYAALLQRKTGLPILVSGGLLPQPANKTLAQAMAETLKQDFNAGEIWLEDASLSTAENALMSKSLLAQKQVDSIYLVTEAWHMPRALEVFEKQGLKVIPAPTMFLGKRPLNWQNLLPSASGLNISRHALRELGATVWYRLRY